MTEGQPSFTSFWQRSKDHISNKALKFVNAVPNPDDEDKEAQKLKVSREKADRRTQVRRAQKEHRARKKNYTKYLEEEIAQLRDKILSTEQATTAIGQENNAIRDLLKSANISPRCVSVKEEYSVPSASSFQSSVSIAHDDAVGAPRLWLGNQGAEPLNQSDIAIDFILSLEHPCRTHIPYHVEPTDWDRAETSHSIMASAYYFRSAPKSLFSDDGSLANSSTCVHWEAPSLELETLYHMSKSLGTDDLEVTPVQIWFELVEHFDAEEVLKPERLEALKRELGPLVDCHKCGAVILRCDFNEAMRKVFMSCEISTAGSNDASSLERPITPFPTA